jgi:hypothetical protein
MKMVFKYMVTDTDLVEGEVCKPQSQESQVVQTTETATLPPKKRLSFLPKQVKFCLLVLANVILFSYFYNRFAPEGFPRPWANMSLSGKKMPNLNFITPKKLNVTGIMYYDENPAAIVGEKVVYEGDAVQGCKVVKIYRDKVEFQKNGKHFTKHISK